MTLPPFWSDESLKHQCEDNMMSERKPWAKTNTRASFGFVLLLLFSSLGALLTAPASSASVSGSLGLTDSASPTEDSWYSAFDTMTFSVEVSNLYATPSANGRGLAWYVCEGEVTSSTCKSNFDEKGLFSIGSLPASSSNIFTSTDMWIPGGNAEGAYTVVFAFDQNDQNPSDDELVFNINITEFYIDAMVNNLHDPLENINNLATYNGSSILNTGTDYTFNARGQATICGDCSFDADFGWQLWDSDETMMLREAYRNISTLAAWGGMTPFNINLPAFSFNQEGEYIMKWGVFSSTGNPHGDLNPSNNIASTSLVLDDSIDLQVVDVYPSHNSQASTFYYGTDRVKADILNQGNMSIDNVTAAFEVYDEQFQLEVQDSCDIAMLHPGESATCSFNLTTTGTSRLLRVQLPTIFQAGEDARMADNLFSFNADVETGAINPYVQTNAENNIYESSDDVELVGRFSSIASQPLNYTWREGFYNWGHGQVLNETGETFGLGHHSLTLEVRDPFGNTEYAYVEFDVLNSINLSVEPYWTGYAVTEQEADVEHEIALPYLGSNYGIGEGKSPLMMISIDIIPATGNEIVLRELYLDMNLSELLPSNIDLSTVDLRYLPTLSSTLWTYIDGVDTYEISEAGIASLSLTKDGVILIVGVLPETNVTVDNLNWTRLAGGQIELNWTAVGDITNPYVGGWNIYKLQGVSGTTFFPDPNAGINEDIWEELTGESFATTMALSDESWLDPEPLPTGICASYAILPIDREGNPNYEMAEIARNNGAPGLLCGDAIPPTTSIIQFNHEWQFTNDTDCFDYKKDWSLCYVVNLTWIWPDHEAQGELKWNLYRLEYAPSNVDLKFINPIAAGLSGTPGEQGTFNQSGMQIDGIQPYRTYYYVLAPIDSVGNEQMIANYPSDNVERVSIQDDWWTYNQHLIPPEPEPPEPPLGIPWLQKLNDATQVSEFQFAGFALLGIFVLNAILLPLLLKKRKRLKRVMEARKRNRSKDYDSEFDDFFE